ncbi:MAG TPA: HyaD/HybD family hydrogenase maturation endopeptidase [Myxococcota bacterium]|jgi:hydrogenase maturation protease|nr:HyaD/HybD family hydrogenase maturation endopeptidase [Myxococcota bacterium]
MSEPGGTAVIGLGSPLMGDDGVGLAALARLRERFAGDPGVDWIDGGTAGLALLPVIEAARRVLLLDAIDAGAAPGTLVELEGAALPRRLAAKLSPHQVDVGELLALAALRGAEPEQLVAIGVQPERVALGVGLSEPVAAALAGFVEGASARLRAWGHRGTGIGTPAANPLAGGAQG